MTTTLSATTTSVKTKTKTKTTNLQKLMEMIRIGCIGHVFFCYSVHVSQVTKCSCLALWVSMTSSLLHL